MAEEVSVKETSMKMGGGESEITLKVTENSYFFRKFQKKKMEIFWKYFLRSLSIKGSTA